MGFEILLLIVSWIVTGLFGYYYGTYIERKRNNLTEKHYEKLSQNEIENSSLNPKVKDEEYYKIELERELCNKKFLEDEIANLKYQLETTKNIEADETKVD